MRVLKLDRERSEAIKTALCIAALFSLARAVDSVYGVMCDPRIKIAGASPYGTTSIFGAPVWAAFLLAVLLLFIVIKSTLPKVSLFLDRYRLVMFVASIILTVTLPMLPFPHRILGACKG